MDITKCEFCNTYIANFEVHDCVRFGNQYRQTSATLPQSSYTNLAEDIELTTVEQMDHEARWLSTSEFNSSIQESFFSNMHQRGDCEETAAAKMSSQYEVSNYYQYNPNVSDFLIPGKPSVDENKSKSLNLQRTSEESKAYRNVQYFDALNPEYPANTTMTITGKCVLPGFQQTFGQRNALMNQMFQHNNAISQMEYPGISRKNEMSSNFLSPYNNFGETDHILNNLRSQYSVTSLETPFLNIQKSQCNTRNLIPSTTSIDETETFPFTILTCDKPFFHTVSHSANRLCCDRERNILNTSGAEYPNSIIDTISLPSASDISLENPETQVINLDTLKFKEDVNNLKNKQWAVFSSGIAENICNPSHAIQTQQHNFGTGRSSNTEHLAWEYSCPVTYSSEGQIVCNIYTTTIANESNSSRKKHSEDKIVSECVNSTEESDTASGNTRKQSSKCDKDRAAFLPKDHHIFPGPSRTVAKPYNCSFCGKTYAIDSSLKRHVRTHTGDGLYPCTECSKIFTCSSHLRSHLRTHTGEKPFKCTKCGKCFSCKSGFYNHVRTHTAEKIYQCNKCSKRYARNSNLKRHMLKHTGEEVRKCYSCDAEFSSEESLGAHKCENNK